MTASASLKRMNEIISFRLAVHEIMPSNLHLIKIRASARKASISNLIRTRIVLSLQVTGKLILNI